jgi:tetratricopeptide (TPR) repeat protein
MTFPIVRPALMLVLAVAVSVAAGDDLPTQREHAAHSGHSLGKVEFPVSCTAEAQTQFNGAAALLHHMTYPQARDAFEQVVATDPKCAMAHWGIAMTLFQPLWPTRPSAADLKRGWEESQAAKTLKPPSEREQLFIATTEAFFLEPASPDYWLRIRRWAAAADKLHAAFPDDPEASALYALSLLATTPANAVSREHADRAAAILVGVYEHNPDHPGAMHYLVHANDVPGRERELLEITRKYESIAPNNPHALHMPTHIYTRLGDWPAVIRGNTRAAEAALAHPAGEHGEYVWDEFPHAIEYMVYALLQQGADDEAAAQIRRMHDTPRIEPTFKLAFHTASTRARYALELHRWNDVLEIEPRDPATVDWNRFGWPESIGWFARGVSAAHLHRNDVAKTAIEHLDQLERSTRASGEELFARNIRVLRLEASAWLAQAAGDEEQAVATMREAAELEASTPKHSVTPAPTIPAYEQLGDLLMEQRRPNDALAAYRRSLELYPRRFNTLLGAARAADAAQDGQAASGYYRELLDVAAPGSKRPAMSEARQYLARAEPSVRSLPR